MSLARQDWSREEVEACVAAYITMLTLELNGQQYNKTQHAERLMRQLRGRSRGSVEFKHCNISAVMLALGYPYINGYKPRANIQALLIEVVESQVAQNSALHAAAEDAVRRPATTSPDTVTTAIWVPVPQAPKIHDPRASYHGTFTAVRRDYLAQEARNRSLGEAGELFVAEVEARRLHAVGKRQLAERVEHVAATQGDGLGFDVLSFNEDGSERLIEVKTTTFGELTPFFVTRNELARSAVDAESYHLYRVFDFRRRPRLFDLPGHIQSHCDLEAATYLARLADG